MLAPALLAFAVVSQAAPNAAPAFPPGCALDASIADPSAAPLPLASFDLATPRSVRRFVEHAGRPVETRRYGTQGLAMTWRVADGREVEVRAHDACHEAMPRLRGVVDGDDRPGTPDEVLRLFYRWKLTPAAPRSTPYEGADAWLGTELFAALEAQRAYERECARLVPPDVKPYMFDADVLMRWSADGADRVEGWNLRVAGDVAIADVAVALDGFDEVYRGVDHVLMARRGDTWRIVDIRWDDGDGVVARLRNFASGTVCSGPPRG